MDAFIRSLIWTTLVNVTHGALGNHLHEGVHSRVWNEVGKSSWGGAWSGAGPIINRTIHAILREER